MKTFGPFGVPGNAATTDEVVETEEGDAGEAKREEVEEAKVEIPEVAVDNHDLTSLGSRSPATSDSLSFLRFIRSSYSSFTLSISDCGTGGVLGDEGAGEEAGDAN